MKKLLLILISVLSLQQFTQAQTTNPCGLYLNGYNQTTNYSISYCGGDSVNLLIQGGSATGAIMTLNDTSGLITSSSYIQFNGLQQPTLSISFLAPYLNTTTTYNFTLSLLDTSCADAGSQLLTANYSITIYASAQMNLYFPNGVCENSNLILLNQGYPTGGTYSGNGVIQIGTSYYFDPSLAGVGVHSITYASGLTTPCPSSVTSTIQVKPAPSVSVNDTFYCEYDPYPIVTPTTTGTINSYLWTNLSNGNIYTNPSLVAAAGTYSLQVKDINGCIASTIFTVTENPLPSANILTDSFCLPTVLTQVPNNPNYTYLWNTGATTASIYVDTAMLYHLTVTDTTTGCTAEDSIKICPSDIGCVIVEEIICPGDTASLCFSPCDSLAGTNYQYLWSTGDTTPCIYTTTAGTYILTVYDTTGVVGIYSAIIYANNLNAQILGGDSLYCINGYIQLSSGAVPLGTYFQWSTSTGYTPPNSNDSTIAFSASNLGTGTHQIYLAIQNDICFDYDTISFEVMPITSGIIGDSIICYGDSLHLTASPQDPSFSYSWAWMDNGIMYYSTGPSLSFLPTTNTIYQLTVSNSVCTSSYAGNILFYNNYNVPFIGDTIMCSGDSLQIAVDLPDSLYSFLWNTGDTTAGITVYSGGTYTVDVTLNSTGCASTNSINITTIPSPNSQTIYGDTIMCSNMLDSLWTDSLSGLHYTWTGNVQDTMLYINGAGTYSLLITDTTTNCSSYQEITVSNYSNNNYYIFPEPDTIACLGDSIRLIILDSITNTVPPTAYTILWNTNATTNAIHVGVAGTYWAAITDLNGCTDTVSINITINPLPYVNISVNTGMACEDSTLLIIDSLSASVLNPSGISWGDDSLWVYSSGTYSVGVTDTNGCYMKDSISVITNLNCCEVPDADIVLENPGTSSDLMTLNVGVLQPHKFNGKKIFIKGDLLINNPGGILFLGCEVIMAPMTKITVVNSVFDIASTYIHGCADSIWQGIFVESDSISITENSIIEDAIEAVVMSPTGQLSHIESRLAEFRNNIYGIVCHSATDPNSRIRQTYFTNDKKLFYNQHNGIQVDSSFVGIWLKNVQGLTIGEPILGNFNLFNNLQYGIVAYKSDFNVYNNHFEDINLYHSNAINPQINNPSITNPTYQIRSACIFAKSWYPFPRVMNIGSTTTADHSNTFKDFNLGIYGYRMNTDVIGNNFYDGTEGIRSDYNTNRTLNIFENTIQDVWVGIGALINNNVNSCNIIDNTIEGLTAQQYLAITVDNFTNTSSSNINISKNCINNYMQGIGQGYINGIRIDANFINNTEFGIASSVSDNGLIQSNRIVGSNSSHINGTYAYLSKQHYQCNSIENYTTAMYFRGNCKSKLKRNTMYANSSYSINGIMLDHYGDIGIQGIPPSGFNFAKSWANEWIGYGIGGFGPSQIHTDNNTIGALSKFYVRPILSHVPWNSTTSFSTFVPYSFAFSPNLPPACGPLPSCSFKVAPPPVSNDEFTELAQLELEALLGDGTYNPDIYQNKERLYKELLEEPELVDSSLILENFRDSIEQTDMGRLVRIEKAIADSAYIEAAAINDSILGVNDIETTAKDFYNLHLAPYLRGEEARDFTTTELADMRAIANLCPFTHGKLVYAARTLCRLHDATWIDYTQPCELPTTSSSRFAAPEQLENRFNVYPNPAKDRINIEIEYKDRESLLELHLINNLGQIIEMHQATSQQELSIDISHLPSGTYLLNLADINGNTIATQKLTKE